MPNTRNIPGYAKVKHKHINNLNARLAVSNDANVDASVAVDAAKRSISQQEMKKKRADPPKKLLQETKNKVIDTETTKNYQKKNQNQNIKNKEKT